uniref:Uncharacterized protein n=1 Tax=Fagus sylvatica TaxID=28930 RepID=A0A2N9FHZ8_FAGSY
MRHWWTLLGEDDHADIVGIFGKFPSLSCGYKLIVACSRLLLPSGIRPIVAFPSERWISFPPWRILRPEIARPEETWRKANISLDLLTKYFSRSDFPVELARDFIAGKKGWKKVPNQCLQDRLRRYFSLSLLPAGRIDLGVIPLETGRGGSDVLHTAPSSFGSAVTCGISTASRPLITLRGHTVSQTVDIALPFTGNSRDWALYLLDLPLSYYPSLALRQFGGVQYPPRLGDLDAVTFDYIPSEDMWRLLSRIEDIWGGRLSEIVLIEDGSPGDSSVHLLILSSGERGGLPSFTLRPTVRPELEEARAELASLRLARASEREESAARVESMRSTLHHNSVAVANLRRDLEAQRRERLVDPATGRPQDIVASPTGARCELSWTWCMMLLSPMLLGSIRRVSLWSLALHQINQVMDSLGARARAVWEEHDEGDPALSTALGRFCRETCIRLGH